MRTVHIRVRNPICQFAEGSQRVEAHDRDCR
jgi:hypothetical protein